jgi:uncharacterized protein
VKILALSDEVLEQIYSPTVRERFGDVDLILGCGDLPFYYLEFIVSALDVPLLYVLGNHDRGPQYTADGRVLTSVQGGHNIHGHVVQEQGLLIAGLEGSMRYRPEAPLMYTEAEMRLEVLKLLPRLWLNRMKHGRALDILITHSPPRGIHDQSDLPHKGFEVFLPLLKFARPRYLLHGHIHLYRPTPQETQFESTKVINIYPLRVLEWA